jgi:tRNA(Ile)-lysidine synthase
VSGGPDSLALLLLAKAAGSDRFEAATVDHGLRLESAAEARFVADLCAELDVRHTILRVEVATGNLQAQAREARYAALHGWARERGLGTIATAHHADDQAETVLMRLNRGSGIGGLSGIRRETYPFDDGMAVIRPLLGWRKAELEAIVAAAGIEPVRDPSNENADFDRVRMRKLLAENDWLDPLAIARSATHLASAEALLTVLSAREWDEQVTIDGTTIRYRPLQPTVIRLGIVARAVHLLGGRGAIRGSAVAALEEALTQGHGGNLGGVLARVVDGEWIFEPEPPRRSG